MPRVLDYSQPVNRASPLNRGLVSWWLAVPWYKSGPRLIDIAGRNHGTLTNGPTWQGALGRHGGLGCLSFDGTDDLVSIPTTLAFSAPLTVMFWARSNSTSTGQYVSDSRSPVSASNSNGLACILGFQSGFWNIFRDSGSGGAYPTGTATDSQMAASGSGIWEHVAWTWNGTTVAGYVNGTPKISVTASQWSSGTVTGRQLSSPYGFTSAPFGGQQDDAAIFSRVLSAAEIFARYQDSRRGSPETLNWQRRTTVFDMGGGGPTTNRRRRLIICGSAA